MIAFQLVVQHRAAGVLTSTNFNLDALVGWPTSRLGSLGLNHKTPSRKRRKGPFPLPFNLPRTCGHAPIFHVTVTIQFQLRHNSIISPPMGMMNWILIVSLRFLKSIC
jgi:hypothetical protein